MWFPWSLRYRPPASDTPSISGERAPERCSAGAARNDAWRFRAAWLLAITSVAAPFSQEDARGGDTPEYRIACRVVVDRDPALTRRLADEITDSTRKAFQAVLGPEHKFRISTDPIAAYTDGTLARLDERAIMAQWTSSERLLLVHVGGESNQFVIEACEYDPRFQTLGPVCDGRTMQRELVPSAAGKIALRAFSPVAEVRAATGTNVHVEFRAGRRIQQYRAWLGLDGDVGLQVMSEVVGRGDEPTRATRYRKSFLVLRSWDGAHAECELVGPDARTMFQRLGSGSVRYLARPARGDSETVAVQVVRRDGQQPHEGCEVFVSPQQYTTDPIASRGVTDHTGQVRFETKGGGVQFVSVRYEDLVVKAPLLPGASSNPLVFELQTRGRRADYVRPLKQLVAEIDDQYRVDLQLREDLKAKAEAKDTTELRKLVARGRQKRITVEEVDERAHDAEFRAHSDGEDVSALATFVREAAAKKIPKDLDQMLAEFNAWADRLDRQTTADELMGRINDAQSKMDWSALVPLYERLVELAPENPEFAAQLRRLQNNLRIKSPEHAAARDFAETELKGITSRDLATRWPQVQRSLHALLAAKDHLTLLKVRRTMNTWARDLSQEVKGVADQIKAAGDDEDRVQQLSDQLRRLTDLNQSLLKLHRDVQDFLEKLEL